MDCSGMAGGDSLVSGCRDLDAMDDKLALTCGGGSSSGTVTTYAMDITWCLAVVSLLFHVL